jgi:hypothetical protein
MSLAATWLSALVVARLQTDSVSRHSSLATSFDPALGVIFVRHSFTLNEEKNGPPFQKANAKGRGTLRAVLVRSLENSLHVVAGLQTRFRALVPV